MFQRRSGQAKMSTVIVSHAMFFLQVRNSNALDWTKEKKAHNSGQMMKLLTPGARFSKAPETFRGRKAIFRSSVCKDREVYRPETSCMKWSYPHIKKM